MYTVQLCADPCPCNALLHQINLICLAHAEVYSCRNTATGGYSKALTDPHTLSGQTPKATSCRAQTALAEDQQQSSHKMLCIAFGSSGQAPHNSSHSHKKAGTVKQGLCLEDRYGRLVGYLRQRSFNCLHCFLHDLVIDRKGHDQHMRLHAGQAAAPGTWTGACTPPQAHSTVSNHAHKGRRAADIAAWRPREHPAAQPQSPHPHTMVSVLHSAESTLHHNRLAHALQRNQHRRERMCVRQTGLLEQKLASSCTPRSPPRKCLCKAACSGGCRGTPSACVAVGLVRAHVPALRAGWAA